MCLCVSSFVYVCVSLYVFVCARSLPGPRIMHPLPQPDLWNTVIKVSVLSVPKSMKCHGIYCGIPFILLVTGRNPGADRDRGLCYRRLVIESLLVPFLAVQLQANYLISLSHSFLVCKTRENITHSLCRMSQGLEKIHLSVGS